MAYELMKLRGCYEMALLACGNVFYCERCFPLLCTLPICTRLSLQYLHIGRSHTQSRPILGQLWASFLSLKRVQRIAYGLWPALSVQVYERDGIMGEGG